MKIKLSVVVITFNEERNLQRCLESVRNIADEILIVDSFSTDQTENIAQKFNTRFIRHKFEGHIQQKNYALEQASFDYILSLDADEALSPVLEQEINKRKENWKADSYSMNRMTSYCGKWIRHGGWYPDRKVRLFKKNTGQWGGVNPHDRFISVPGASQEHLAGDLLHYSYYSIEGHIGQVNKFTSIGADEAFRAGKKASLLHVFFSPCIKFMKDYVFRLGFMDGYYGWVIACISAHATFLKYVKLRELGKKKEDED